jgi:hypothetical protein
MPLLEKLPLRENDVAQWMDARYDGLYLTPLDVANEVLEHVRLKDRAPEQAQIF